MWNLNKIYATNLLTIVSNAKCLWSTKLWNKYSLISYANSVEWNMKRNQCFCCCCYCYFCHIICVEFHLHCFALNVEHFFVFFSTYLFYSILTSSLQSTWTRPLSNSLRNKTSSPRIAAKCNCISDGVSFYRFYLNPNKTKK